MEAHDCRRGVARKREDALGDVVAGVVFDRDSGERSGFPRLHVYAAKVYCSAKGALDGGLEEVEFAHGDTTRGYDYVAFAEGITEGLFEGAGSVASVGLAGILVWFLNLLIRDNSEIDDFESMATGSSDERRTVCIAHFPQT